MCTDAKLILDRINETYSGVFGKFQPDSDNDEFFATALHPILGNRHTEGNRITISVEENIEEEYANRVDFVDDKTKPSIMGKPVDLAQTFGFEKEHGRLNNFSMMGTKGGYVFFTGYIGKVLFCAELHVQKRHMTEDELSDFMKTVVEAISG